MDIELCGDAAANWTRIVAMTRKAKAQAKKKKMDNTMI
jgi:hypothetical protein